MFDNTIIKLTGSFGTRGDAARRLTAAVPGPRVARGRGDVSVDPPFAEVFRPHPAVWISAGNGETVACCTRENIIKERPMIRPDDGYILRRTGVASRDADVGLWADGECVST